MRKKRNSVGPVMALCLNFFVWRQESHRFGLSLHSTKILVDSLIIAAAEREVTVYCQEKLSFLTLLLTEGDNYYTGKEN